MASALREGALAWDIGVRADLHHSLPDHNSAGSPGSVPHDTPLRVCRPCNVFRLGTLPLVRLEASDVARFLPRTGHLLLPLLLPVMLLLSSRVPVDLWLSLLLWTRAGRGLGQPCTAPLADLRAYACHWWSAQSSGYACITRHRLSSRRQSLH